MCWLGDSWEGCRDAPVARLESAHRLEHEHGALEGSLQAAVVPGSGGESGEVQVAPMNMTSTKHPWNRWMRIPTR